MPDAMSEPLSEHIFYTLDEDLPGWGIFELVQPFFASNLPWTPVVPSGLSQDKSAPYKVRFDTSKRTFRAHLTALPGLLPDKTLSEPEFRVCRNALRPLLCFLDSLVSDTIPVGSPGVGDDTTMAGDTDKGKKDGEEAAAKMAGLRLWTSSLVPQGWVTGGTALLANLTNFVTTALAFTQAAGTATSLRQRGAVGANHLSTETDDDELESATNLDNLRSLGQFIRRNPGTDPVELCRDHVRLKILLDQLEQATHVAGEVCSVFASTLIPKPPPDGKEISETNWEELRPRQVSSQLFYLLRERTCWPRLAGKKRRPERKFHEAKLQLDGFLLDSITDSVRLDVFLSSCPPPPFTRWRQGWYTAVSR